MQSHMASQQPAFRPVASVELNGDVGFDSAVGWNLNNWVIAGGLASTDNGSATNALTRTAAAVIANGVQVQISANVTSNPDTADVVVTVGGNTLTLSGTIGICTGNFTVPVVANQLVGFGVGLAGVPFEATSLSILKVN